MDRGSGANDHSAWIGLARGGPLVALADTGDAERLVVTPDSGAFGELLSIGHPRVAIVASPPAVEGDLHIAVRERRRRPGLRLMHLSPADAIGDRIEALRRGFDDALPETVDPLELLGRIRLLDDRTRTRTESTIQVADGVWVDLIAHEVRRDGVPIHLRPKEFQLLAMLAGHPGRAYTRRQLLDRVWGPEHEGDPRTVDVHVRWLRSKIEAQPEHPVHLVTVRGVGYRLDPEPR
jgi:DNA-binding response OmpR family regulator